MEKTIVKIWGREIPPYETFYWGVSEGYFFGVIGGGISRTVKCDDSLAILTLEKEEEMENEINDTSSPEIAEPKIEYLGSYVPSGNSNNPVLGSRGVSTTIRANMHGMPPAVIDNLGSYKPNGYNASCVVGGSGIAPTVRENHGEVTAVMHPKYRIRKLTPRECFRLMDVDDADIDKIQRTGICNSQQYKLAGNSIVVNVLYHIFRKMFVEQGNEEQQLKLF